MGIGSSGLRAGGPPDFPAAACSPHSAPRSYNHRLFPYRYSENGTACSAGIWRYFSIGLTPQPFRRMMSF